MSFKLRPGSILRRAIFRPTNLSGIYEPDEPGESRVCSIPRSRQDALLARRGGGRLECFGGSKKHLCQSAESDSAPARHCCNASMVAAIMPPSAESKITTIPAGCGVLAVNSL